MKSLTDHLPGAIRDLDSLGNQWQALKHIELRSDSCRSLSSLLLIEGSTLVMQCECKLVLLRHT
jgi:hypothetical protein